MTMELVGPAPKNMPIAYFDKDHLVFYPDAERTIVATNIKLRGIELPRGIRHDYQNKAVINYPTNNAAPEMVKLFKKAFLEFYFPDYLEPWDYKLINKQ